MEQKFKTTDNGIDIQTLRDFCEREGEVVCYNKGEQLEIEGHPDCITFASGVFFP